MDVTDSLSPEKQVKKRKKLNSRSKRVTPKKPETEMHEAQPKLMVGGRLRDYQIHGFQWMVGLYENGTGLCIGFKGKITGIG